MAGITLDYRSKDEIINTAFWLWVLVTVGFVVLVAFIRLSPGKIK